MGRNAKPRKRRQERATVTNAFAIAANAVRRLSAADVANAQAPMDEAFAAFDAGTGDMAEHWAIMAESMNMAEALAAERICSDLASRQTIAEAQGALARLHHQHRVLGAWVMWPEDREALAAGAELHRLQLSLCSYAELCRALDRVKARMQGARAGNVAPGTTVLEGPIHG